MTGFINVNKAAGASSAQEVGKIRRLTGRPCGHMGTLDPMASGVLPVAIGNAARLFNYFLDKKKTYLATFRFGVRSDTLDTTGNVEEGAGAVPCGRQIEEALGALTGEIMQVPPRYSAKNVAGRRGYQLARAGVDFELAPKKVTVYAFRLKEQTAADSFCFEIECGGGTYIRALARDLAQKLGTCAVMSALVRTRSGAFLLKDAVAVSELSAKNIESYVIPTESVLSFDGITPDGAQAKRLFNGLEVGCDKPDGIYKIYTAEGLFYGLAEVRQSKLKVRTKLC